MRSRAAALLALAPLLASSALAQCDAWIDPAQPRPYDGFGRDLAHGGDVLYVGRAHPTWLHPVPGRVEVFRRSPGGWTPAGGFTSPTAQPFDAFGYVVRLDGDTLAVGAPQELPAGRIYLYDTTAAGWVPNVVLAPPAGGTRIGYAFALHGDVLLATSDDGLVWFFERAGGAWSLVATFDSSQGTAPPSNGLVELHGDVAVVPKHLTFNDPDAEIYVYEKIGGSWTLGQVLAYDRPIRRAVVTEAGILLADHTRYGFRGAVSILRKSGAAWSIVDELRSALEGAVDFGSWITTDGETLVVDRGDQTAETFRREGLDWVFAGARPGLPGAVALSGMEVAFPEPHPVVQETGRVRVAALICFEWASYCGPATLNSTGLSAVLAATGTEYVAANDVSLHATQLPANQLGLFLASATQGFVPFAGGSQGHLCLGGAIGRYVDDAASTGPAGELHLALDLTAVPQPGGAASVLAGETWNWQAWFRDLNPGPTSNFTQGVSVTFR